jgi:hypothetical protein
MLSLEGWGRARDQPVREDQQRLQDSRRSYGEAEPVVIFDLTNYYSSNCGLKYFFETEEQTTTNTSRLDVTSDTVDIISTRVKTLGVTESKLHDKHSTDIKTLGDTELLQIHQFRRIHMRASAVAAELSQSM